MRRKAKWIGLIAVLIAFAAGTYVMTEDNGEKMTYTEDSKPQRKAKPVEKDKLPILWNEVDTYEQVEGFFEQYIPGLHLAREYGVTTAPKQSVEIPGRDGRIQVNEVWHSGHTIHIFYSIDLSAIVGEDASGDAPYLESVSIEKKNDIQKQTLRSFGQPIRFEQGVIFENRLYTVIQVPPISQKPETANSWRNTESIPAFNQNLNTIFKFQLGGQTYQPDSIPIHYQYDPEKNTLGTYTFDHTYNENGLTIAPLTLKLGIDYSHIKMKIKSESSEFNHSLDATLITDKNEHIPLSLYLQKDPEQKDVYTGFIRPLRYKPEKATLKIRNIHLRDGSSYSFSIKTSQIKRKDQSHQRIDKKVAEAYQTDVYLKEISSRGSVGTDLI
ncbi:hypothetical protein, partial [Halobacillus sp. BBL2006]|uniref:hypothetical protein n=1 Tax=Halobacillus sp. BBL2006 TaxID=1543706 RepID=UPI000541DB15